MNDIGEPGTGITRPAGARGIVGWLSGIYDRLATTPAGANVIGGVTIADGSHLTAGAKADAAYTGSGAASLVALLKGLYAAMVAPTPAGTNLIGKVQQKNGSYTRTTTGSPSTSAASTAVYGSSFTPASELLAIEYVYYQTGTAAIGSDGYVALQASLDGTNFFDIAATKTLMSAMPDSKSGVLLVPNLKAAKVRPMFYSGTATSGTGVFGFNFAIMD